MGAGSSAVEGTALFPEHGLLDSMYFWSRRALRRCAEFGGLVVRGSVALPCSSRRRLAGPSPAFLPLGSRSGQVTPFLSTTRTPWTSTEYASCFFPIRRARSTSRQARPSSRPARFDHVSAATPLRLAAGLAASDIVVLSAT